MTVTAWFGESLKSTALAAADLSGNEFYAVQVGSTGVTLVSTQGASQVKVLTNKPKIGDPAQLWDAGETKMIAGAAITVGQTLMTDTSGRFIPYVDNGVNVPVGECRSPASVAGDIFTGLIWPAPSTGAGQNAILDGITAHAGGGQASAVQLTNGWNRVTTVATAADSVQLPAALPGSQVLVINDAAANSLQVFGKNGNTDTIDGTAGATGEAIAAAKRRLFFCLTAGAWQSLLGA